MFKAICCLYKVVAKFRSAPDVFFGDKERFLNRKYIELIWPELIVIVLWLANESQLQKVIIYSWVIRIETRSYH